jgi:hypothetical protein
LRQDNRPRSYSSAIEAFERLAADFPGQPSYRAQNAVGHNNLAWLLATCQEPQFRDATRAIAAAKKAGELAPQEGNHWNTLGVANYRARLECRYRGVGKAGWSCAKAATASISSSWPWHNWKLGEKEKARKWFDIPPAATPEFHSCQPAHPHNAITGRL